MVSKLAGPWVKSIIEGYLRNYRSEGITPVSHETIHRILIEAKLNNPIASPRKVWGRRRFEREHSNSLWQADFKLTEEDEWMISFPDDQSRFIPGSRIHHNPTAEHAITLLEESMKEYGKPDQILTIEVPNSILHEEVYQSSLSSAVETGLSILSRVCGGHLQSVRLRRSIRRTSTSRGCFPTTTVL